MLKELNVDEACFVALLAKAARAQRDDLLGDAAENDLAELKAARGEHNPTAALGSIHFVQARHKQRRCGMR